MTPSNTILSDSGAMRRPVILAAGICLALLPTACGGGATNSAAVKPPVGDH